MKGSKTIGLVILLMCFMIDINAQSISFQGNGGETVDVMSFDGTNRKDGSSFLLLTFASSGSTNIKPGWKMKVRAESYSASNGKFFPVDKIYLQPKSINVPSNITFEQLGIKAITPILNNMDVFLIKYSNFNMIAEYYFQLQFTLKPAVVGGSYLADLSNVHQTEYPIRFYFTIYDENDIFIANTSFDYKIQVSSNLTGTPPTENNFSIQISNSAKNGLLELKSIADYINGKSVTYQEGITVSSNVAYQLNMKYQSQYFESVSNDGKKLPLDVLKVQLLPNGNEVALSASPQTLYKGESTNSQSQSFDLKYSTIPNDQRLFEADVEEYKTTLTYEITVQ